MGGTSGGVRAAQFGWIIVVAAASIAAYTGNATPYVAPSQLPGGTADAGTYMFGSILVVGFGGSALMALVAGDSWQDMDEETDLTLGESGVTGRGTYTGVIDGRQVRARTEKRKTGQWTEGGSSYTTYTITEADLDAPLESGIILRRQTEGGNRMDVGDSSIEQAVIDGEFVLTGVESERLAREVLTREVRQALRAVENLETVTIGAASEVITEELPSMGDSMVGGFLEDKMEAAMTKNVGGTPTTVGIETSGVLGDPSTLDDRTAAVAAVANAFEDARREG
jgi:hypothetical protein